MSFRSHRLMRSWLLLATVLLSACASMPSREPLQVTVAGVESLPGEGMELRLLVSARDASALFDLRCEVRERMIAFLQERYPGSLPRLRAELHQG